MGKYKIADLIIEINPKYSFSEKLMKDYEYGCNEKADFTVSITDEMMKYEKSAATEPLGDELLETTAILRCISREVLKNYNGFFFHSSCIEKDERAYIFTAPSGTGKSTHTRLWREYFGKEVTMINDDKPIIRKQKDTFYVYGTPWQGKSNIGNNIKSPVKAVCFLRQGKENKIKKISKLESLALFMDQTERPKDKKSMENLLELFDDFLNRIPVYLMECNISYEAVLTAYNEMSK